MHLYMHIKHHSTPQQKHLHIFCCMADIHYHTDYKIACIRLFSYPAHIESRLAELHDSVHANLTQAASTRKTLYDHYTSAPPFTTGDPFRVTILKVKKLDP